MRKISARLTILVALVLMLTACSRSATQPPGHQPPGPQPPGRAPTWVSLRVVQAAADLPARGPEPYVRLTASALASLGMPITYTSPSQNRVVRLQVNGQVLDATWELYTAEGDLGPIFRLTDAGLKQTGLQPDADYAALYDPDSKIITIRPAGK